MAQLVFTQEDERLIESLVEEFDPVKHPASAPMVDLMPAEEWGRFVEAFRNYVRAKATTCIAAVAYATALRDEGLLNRDGLQGMMRSDLWWVNFGLGSELPEELADRGRFLPMGPSGEWSMSSDYVIDVGTRIEERFTSGLTDVVAH